VTQETKFFNLSNKSELELYQELIYFSDYAAASYGWPFYVYRSRCACLKLLPNIRNCICPKQLCGFNNQKLNDTFKSSYLDDDHIENDNCCFCYYDAVLKQLPKLSKSSMSGSRENHVKLIHANFSSDVSINMII
jgi:hypothetical protein